MKRFFQNNKGLLSKIVIFAMFLSLCTGAIASAQVKAEEDTVTITSQPKSTTVTSGNITENLTVEATTTSTGSALIFQWYSCENTNRNNAKEEAGATENTFAIPNNLTAGSYYYFCEVGAEGANAVQSAVATVTVENAAAVVEDVPEAHDGNIGECGKCTWSITDGVLTVELNNHELSGTWPWTNDKASIKEAIVTGKASGSMSQMFAFCTELTTVNLSGLDTSQVTNMKNMFNGCSKLTALDLSGFNTSNVTDMASMFYNCSSLETVNIGNNFITTNVTTMKQMFQKCSSLTAVNVSGFDTTNVTDMTSMFSGCKKLTALDVSEFSTANVQFMNSMFSGCTVLTELDLGNFDTSNVTYMSMMFYGCSGLTALDLSNFNTSKVVDMEWMFDGCAKLKDLDISSFEFTNNTLAEKLSESISTLTALTSFHAPANLPVDITLPGEGWTDAEGNPCDNVAAKDKQTAVLYTKSAAPVSATYNYTELEDGQIIRSGDTLVNDMSNTAYINIHDRNYDHRYSMQPGSSMEFGNSYEVSGLSYHIESDAWKVMKTGSEVYFVKEADAAWKTLITDEVGTPSRVEGTDYYTITINKKEGYRYFYQAMDVYEASYSEGGSYTNETLTGALSYLDAMISSELQKTITLEEAQQMKYKEITEDSFSVKSSVYGMVYKFQEDTAVEGKTNNYLVTGGASFATVKIARDITVEETVNGTVAATVNGASATKAEEVDTVSLTLTPEDGYEVDKVIVKDAEGNEIIVEDGSFLMPRSAVTVTVTFAEAKPEPATYNYSKLYHGQIIYPGDTIVNDTDDYPVIRIIDRHYQHYWGNMGEGASLTFKNSYAKSVGSETYYIESDAWKVMMTVEDVYFVKEADAVQANLITNEITGVSRTEDKDTYTVTVNKEEGYRYFYAVVMDAYESSYSAGEAYTNEQLAEMVASVNAMIPYELQQTSPMDDIEEGYTELTGDSFCVNSSVVVAIIKVKKDTDVLGKKDNYLLTGVVYLATEKIVRDITVEDTENGTVAVTVNGEAATKAEEVDTVSLTFTPADGYEVDTVIVEDAEGNEITVKEDGSFLMPRSAVTVTVTFAKPVEAAFTFSYAYDCWRDPVYPVKGDRVYLHYFDNPLNANGISGKWELVDCGKYDSSIHTENIEYPIGQLVSDLAGKYNTSASNINVYALKKDGKHICYGIVCTIFKDGVFFIGTTYDEGGGYYLSNTKLSYSDEIYDDAIGDPNNPLTPPSGGEGGEDPAPEVPTVTPSPSEHDSSHDGWIQYRGSFVSGRKYYLTSDVTDAALTITATNVTICLNGHTICGKSSGFGLDNNTIKVANGASVTICDCQKTGSVKSINTSSGTYYGAIYNEGDISLYDVIVDAGASKGYGIYNDNYDTENGNPIYFDTDVELKNCTVKGYEAAIHWNSSANSHSDAPSVSRGSLNADNCTFVSLKDNQYSFAVRASDTTLTNCTLISGGCAFASGGDNVVLSNCKITGNNSGTKTDQRALVYINWDEANVKIEDCEFTNNGQGPAVRLNNMYGSLELAGNIKCNDVNGKTVPMTMIIYTYQNAQEQVNLIADKLAENQEPIYIDASANLAPAVDAPLCIFDVKEGTDYASMFVWAGETPEGKKGTFKTEGTSLDVVVTDAPPVVEPETTYTITLDRTNYADGWLLLCAYKQPAGKEWLGEISVNGETIKIPENGSVRIFADSKFTVKAGNATVSEMQDAGEEGYYYEINGFTTDTTVVVNKVEAPTPDVPNHGDHAGWQSLNALAVITDPKAKHEPIKLSGEATYYLTEDLVLGHGQAIQIISGSKITICTNGYNISDTTDARYSGQTDDTYLISVENGATLIIENCKTENKSTLTMHDFMSNRYNIVNKGTLEVHNVNLTNVCPNYSAAIAMDGRDSVARLYDCTITGTKYDFGVRNMGSVQEGRLIAENCKFLLDSEASSGYAVEYAFYYLEEVMLTDCTVERDVITSNVERVWFENCTLSSTATEDSGGSKKPFLHLQNNNTSDLSKLTNCTLTAPYSTAIEYTAEGGIGAIVLEDCTIKAKSGIRLNNADCKTIGNVSLDITEAHLCVGGEVVIDMEAATVTPSVWKLDLINGIPESVGSPVLAALCPADYTARFVPYTAGMYIYSKPAEDEGYELYCERLGITEQPTNTNPTVEVNDIEEVSSYQWHTVVTETTLLDWSNAWGEIFDEATNQWEASFCDWSNVPLYYCLESSGPYHAGDKLVLELSAPVYGKFAFDDYGYETFGPESGAISSITHEFTEDRNYFVVFFFPAEGQTTAPKMKASIVTNKIGDAIEGQNTNTLTQGGKGKKFACIVTWNEGIALEFSVTSDIITLAQNVGDVEPEEHVHEWSDKDEDWTIIKPATATEEGKKQTTCTLGCGQKKVVSIPATGVEEDESVSKLEKDAEVAPEAPVEEATLNNDKTALLEAPSIFTEEEKTKVESGEEDARVWLEIGKTAENAIAPEDKQEIENAAEDIMGEDATVTYFDADLFKQVGNGEKQAIATPGIEIEITIKIPAGLLNNDATVERVYKIIRLHDGKVDVLTGTFDKATGEFTFASDLFSTYAIVYTDTAVHNHEWASSWTYNWNYHWHECIGAGTCDITSNASKYGYDSHNYSHSYDRYCDQCGYERTIYIEPVATPTPMPTATPTPTPVPTATPIPGLTKVPTMDEAAVDENGKEITNIIKEVGEEAKVVIPGVTDDKDTKVTWRSTNPKVASVDETGKISMLAPGMTQIIVTAVKGNETKIDTIVVLVKNVPEYVNKPEEAIEVVRLGTSQKDIPTVRFMEVGETVDINFYGVKNWKKQNYEYIWSVSDESIARTSNTGVVTALKPGVVTLTLGLKNKATGEFLNVQPITIVIPDNPEEKILLGTHISCTFDKLEVQLDHRMDINFYGVKNWKKEKYEYHWSSSEPTVVWVDNVGQITPIQKGEAIITLVLIEKATGKVSYVVPATITVK